MNKKKRNNLKFIIKTSGEYYNEYQTTQFHWLNEQLIKAGYSIIDMRKDEIDKKYNWVFEEK